jgi:ribosomal protein L29
MEKSGVGKRQTENSMSISSVRKLERELKNLKEKYDSLKNKSLTMQGIETNPAKIKNDTNKLE